MAMTASDSSCDRALAVRLEHGEAHAVAGDLELGLGVVDLRLRVAQVQLCLVVLGPGGEALRQKLPLALIGVAGMAELRLRGGDSGSRRAQGILLVLGIQLGEDLVRLHLVANIDEPVDHPARDPEGEGNLVLSLDMTRQGHCLAGLLLRDHDRADRADVGRLGRSLPVAGCEYDCENRQDQPQPQTAAFSCERLHCGHSPRRRLAHPSAPQRHAVGARGSRVAAG